MKTRILEAGDALPATIAAACAALADGLPVGLPTETVYGLAANALDPIACARIFEAKERPLSDPLIVHVPDERWLEKIAVTNDIAARLAANFWPGPLTMVLPRRNIVPDIVTAGQDTVAVRRSAHPVFSKIVSAFDAPLAAPSANRFGRISPTTAKHVVAELEGRIPLVVDGGSCAHGIESTIVKVDAGSVEILREGPITRGMLEEVAEVCAPDEAGPVVPGSLKSHYAPRTPLDIEPVPPATRDGIGLLAWRPVDEEGFAAVEVLSADGDLRETAANLYAAMRRLDECGLKRIVALPVPEEGIGAAIMERLRKAATR